MSRRIARIGAVLGALAVTAGAAGAAGIPEIGDGTPPAVALPTWSSSYDWPAGDGSFGWQPRPSAADTDAYRLRDDSDDRVGLWAWPAGGTRYAPGGAGWRLTAPSTTRIARATVEVAIPPKLLAHHCLRATLRTDGERRDTAETCKPLGGAAAPRLLLRLFDPSATPVTRHLDVRIEVPACPSGPANACAKWIPVSTAALRDKALVIRAANLLLVDDDRPVIVPSGPFFDLDGRYIDGTKTYVLNLDVRDDGAGVREFHVDHTGWPGPQPQLQQQRSSCDPHHHTPALGARICPPDDDDQVDVDTHPMPEGTRHLLASVTDLAANVGHRAWTVIIDRTPPTPPQEVRLVTPEEGSGQALWTAATDPELPDGTRGSGVAHYLERHRVGDGDWGPWRTDDESTRASVEVYDQPAGTHVAFEVKAVDAVGNASDAVRVEGDVFGSPPSVTLGGRIAGLDGQHVGSERSTLTVAATDDGVGVRRLWAGRDGDDRFGATDASCTARTLPDGTPWKALCPATASHDFTVDTGSLPEGPVTLMGAAVDRAHNRSADAHVTVLVDHTAPIRAGAIAADRDPDTGVTELDWDSGEDPPLPDGSSGSGVAAQELRWRPAGSSAWSAYLAPEDDGTIHLSNLADGDVIDVQVRTTDAVGNASESAIATLTVESPVIPDPVDGAYDIAQAAPGPGGGDLTVDLSGYIDAATSDHATLAPMSLQLAATSEDTPDTDAARRDWRVTLVAPDGRILVDDTDARGFAVFPDEPAGTYTLRSIGLPGEPDAFPYGVPLEYGIAVPPIVSPVRPPSSDDVLEVLAEAIGTACSVFPDNWSEAIDDCKSTNTAERQFCLQHPTFCAAEWKVRAAAFMTAARVWAMPAGSHDGTRANAFQHSFWVAAMRNEAIRRHAPKDWALDLARRHELDEDAQYSHDPKVRKLSDMDLHNNRVGFENASTVSRYRACVGMRRAAMKANAYDAEGSHSIDGATRRQLVYVKPDDAYRPPAQIQARSTCAQHG